eukprot:2696592-Pyramimonas_sp.AAC.1
MGGVGHGDNPRDPKAQQLHQPRADRPRRTTDTAPPPTARSVRDNVTLIIWDYHKNRGLRIPRLSFGTLR